MDAQCGKAKEPTFHVHDDKNLVNVPAMHPATDWSNVRQKPLILLDMIHNHAIFCRYLLDALGVNFPQMLY
jgi:hypothetical protein